MAEAVVEGAEGSVAAGAVEALRPAEALLLALLLSMPELWAPSTLLPSAAFMLLLLLLLLLPALLLLLLPLLLFRCPCSCLRCYRFLTLLLSL